jgi:hypothetical protein
MLGDNDRDRRQLGHLTPTRLGDLETIRLGEHVRTRPAPIGPMFDDLVDLLEWKQPPVAALMPVLATPLPTRPLAT